MIIFSIIVTYNAMRRGWIDRCLQSLQGSTVPVTAIVIDNLSTDGTREYVPAHYPDAVWLPQEKNLGFGQANNIGIRYALEHDADYVLLLNQDASIAPNMLELLLKISDERSLISPIHCNGDGSDFDTNFKRYTLPSNHDLPNSLKDCELLSEAFKIGEVCAACWLMPKRLIHEIGGFNPLFFHYGEDRNYYQRLVYHKTNSYVVPCAKMFHDRNVQGNQTMFNKNLLHNNLLLIISDINLHFLKRLIKLIELLINCYIHELPHKRYRIGAFSSEMFWMLKHSRSIRNSIKQEKLIGKNWL